MAAPSPAPDAIDCPGTWRRFDVAWRHGLASFVCDYLADVCGDPQTSADPVRAYLLDGRCVADWSQKALQRMRSSVRQVRRQLCANHVTVLRKC